MSKKHFIALADALRETRIYAHTHAHEVQWEADAAAIARVCRTFNPRFDTDRWFGYIRGTNGPNGGHIR